MKQQSQYSLSCLLISGSMNELTSHSVITRLRPKGDCYAFKYANFTVDRQTDIYVDMNQLLAQNESYE